MHTIARNIPPVNTPGIGGGCPPTCFHGPSGPSAYWIWNGLIFHVSTLIGQQSLWSVRALLMWLALLQLRNVSNFCGHYAESPEYEIQDICDGTHGETVSSRYTGLHVSHCTMCTTYIKSLHPYISLEGTHELINIKTTLVWVPRTASQCIADC